MGHEPPVNKKGMTWLCLCVKMSGRRTVVTRPTPLNTGDFEESPMSDANLSTSPMVRYEIVKPGYRIGDDGSVWSCVKHVSLGYGGGRGSSTIFADEWHRLKHRTDQCGYLRVRIGWGNRRLVHHLVLEAFVGPCPPGMECRHLDGNKTNNRHDNLKWGTRKENAADRVRHGRSKGEKCHAAVLTEAAVLEAVALRAAGERIAAIARRLGVGYTTIGNILHGKTWNSVTSLPSTRPTRQKSLP